MRIQQWNHCWCHNSRSNVLHLSNTFPVYASFGQQRRIISGMIFAREKTSVYKACTNILELFFGTLSWSTIHVELFWVTFDPSVATLSINTLWVHVPASGPGIQFKKWTQIYTTIVSVFDDLFLFQVSLAKVKSSYTSQSNTTHTSIIKYNGKGTHRYNQRPILWPYPMACCLYIQS